jgi:hypothetical protein
VSPKTILKITSETKVGDVLVQYPRSLDIFLTRGFAPLRNPVLRKTMARAITIEQACRREGVELTALINDLNGVVEKEVVTATPLVSIVRSDQIH